MALGCSRSFDPLSRSSCKIYSHVLYGGNSDRVNLTVRSLAARRHHRRRENSGFGAAPIKSKDSENADWMSFSRSNKELEDKLVITFDVEEWKQRVADGVSGAKEVAKRSLNNVIKVGEEFIDEGQEAWRELRSSVRFQKDKRLVIAVKRSTIEFTGKVLLWSILGTLLVKFLLTAMREYRWGWEEFSRPKRSVRDRSLGGREVLVSKGLRQRDAGIERRNLNSLRGVNNPLDGVEEISRSEKVLARRRNRDAGVSSKPARLPGWWPGAFMPPSASIITRQDAEEKATRLTKGIMQRRLIGYDFELGEMLELRQLCKTAGIKVKFDTPNTRDNFYRAAINYVLTACCRSGGDLSMADFSGSEDGVTFIAGLATNIGLDEDRAATMVNAAVAARTRAGFLQVKALQLQGKFREAEEELLKIIRMHSYFPPDADSPEMELVARGLDSHLNREGKLELLESYERMGGSKTKRVAEEALGLHLPS
ncbi:hypothetical protein R1sor_006717 [Riccia sorocarpa]|uniref:Uncharacterized protein n=1 Tax=Riccia sorocarpa TaxID=122646 RepID=A0ABD3HQH6_9MARC